MKNKDSSWRMKFAQFNEWFTALAEHDRKNLAILAELPNAKQLVDRMEPGNVKTNMEFAVSCFDVVRMLIDQ